MTYLFFMFFFKERDYEVFLLDKYAQRLLPFEEQELE